MATDPIYNARRRAKTLVRNLERIKETQGKRAAASTQKFIDQIQSCIEATYISRGSRERAEKAVSRLQALSGGRASNTRTKSADVLFQREIARATIMEDTPMIGENADIKAKVFFRATQKYWEGTPPSQRFKAIKKGLGFRTVEEAFNYVMQVQSEKIQQILNDDSSLKEKYKNLRARVILL